MFGYELVGIKIISLLDEMNIGFYLYSRRQEKKIMQNELLFSNDSISFKLISEIGVKLDNYTIEYEIILKEPELKDLLSYACQYELFPNKEENNIDLIKSFYQPKFFSGKKAKINFEINKCYQTCSDCLYYGDNMNHFCKNCKEEYPFFYNIEKGYNCVKVCPDNYFNISDNYCIKKSDGEDYNGNNYKNIFNERKYLLDEFSKNNNTDIIIKEGKIILQASSTFNQIHNKNINISSINLGKCEDELKYIYNISNNDSLLIMKLDIFEEGLLIPIIEYEVYNSETKEKLNLTYCKDIKIVINIPVSIDEKNLFKYNLSSDYYNNICFTYSTNKKTDIILIDRKNEFIKYNYSLCEKNCNYILYNITTKNVECDCFVKQNFYYKEKMDIKDILSNLNDFFSLKNQVNIEVMKCYKLLFNKEELSSNIASNILLSILGANFILIIVFIIKGYKNIFAKIDEIKELGEIKNQKQKQKIKRETKNNNPPKKKGKKNKKRNINKIKKNNLDIKFNSQIDNNISINSFHKLKKNTSLNNHYILNTNNIYQKTILSYNDYELNNLPYEEALIIDKRTYIQYYFSLLRTKHLIIFTFYTSNDYNSRVIKICLFLLSFSLYYTMTALFFDESNLHKIYEDEGKYNFIFQLPKLVYSTLISSVINTIVRFLSLSEGNILDIKNKIRNNRKEKEISKTKQCLIIKFITFFILDILFTILFWFYLSCFSLVYKNTQIYLLKSVIIGFSLSLIYPLGLNLCPGLLRIPSLKSNQKKCSYQFSKFIQAV